MGILGCMDKRHYAHYESKLSQNTALSQYLTFFLCRATEYKTKKVLH